MKTKKNCWEIKNCGREIGGAKASKLGTCPAATETKLDGTNGGINAGRACWGVAGTLCGGQIHGTFAAEIRNCFSCDVYKSVAKEEGHALTSTGDIWDSLNTQDP